MLGGETSADHSYREPAEPCHDFELGRLRREVAQQLETDLLIPADDVHKTPSPAGDRLKGDKVGEALDRFGNVGAQQPERVARLGAEAIDPGSRQHRRETGIEHEGQQSQGDGPGHNGKGHEHRRGHEDRDQGRRYGMREEVFDGLDVLIGERDQVAGAAPHQISRRQHVELAEELDPHLRQ